ncbi:YhcN/YlaJ family sporulation lipoprotein [Brevibacillus fluminis]|uniref:YhcN/YlaJ family sporulation lipoprotein n=1 Tax=Brevibacillus fluminis TaxID=511487 RepID=UPI003F8B2002
MKKTWLYGALAGMALLATACGNKTAAPDYNQPAGTKLQQYGTNAAHRIGTYGTMHDGTTNYYGTGYNGYGTVGTTGYGTGTGITGTAGTAGYGATGNTYNNGYNTGGLTGYTGYGGTGYRGAGTYSAYGTTNNAGLHTRYATVPGQSMYQSTRMNTAQNNMPSMGYAKIDAVHARTYSTAHSRVYVDRNALAKAVADVTNSVPGIRSSTVLVTDEEIFVGCTTDHKNAHDSKNKARMNAMSIAPRYYKVYVTDDPGMIAELTRVASTTTHANSTLPQNDSQINALIKRFGGMTDREESNRMGTRSDMHHTTGMK